MATHMTVGEGLWLTDIENLEQILPLFLKIHQYVYIQYIEVFWIFHFVVAYIIQL